jgi:putative transposase
MPSPNLAPTLLASGQINMRKVDGWQTLATTTVDQPIDLAA